MEEKMGCGELPAPEDPRGSAIVMASDESLLGVSGVPVPGEVASGELTPGLVIASGLSAGFGAAAELSPLDTATPSGAFRVASFESPAIPYTSPGKDPRVEEAPPLRAGCLQS